MRKILLFHIVSFGEKYPIYFDIDRIIKLKRCEFTVHPKEEFSAKYHPETITYTGVTVGGIHTGGFTKNEAYYSVNSKKTAHAELSFKDDNELYSIQKVTFSQKLKEVAHSEIGHLFRDPKDVSITLYNNNVNFTQSEFVSAVSSGNQIAMAGINNANLQNYASIDTCSALGRFLMRAIQGEFLTPEQKCRAAKELLEQKETTAWIAAADLLRNPTTPEEIELSKKAAEKSKNTKVYKVGNRIYKDKGNYIKGLVNYIFKKSTAPVIVTCVILFMLSIMPGRDTSGYFIAFLILLFVWIFGFAISEMCFLPDEKSYYETNS